MFSCTRYSFWRGLFVSMAALFTFTSARATTVIGPWVPLFKGVDHSISTNTPSGTLPNLMVIHTVRVDLTDPDIQLVTTPRAPDFSPNSDETGGLTVSDFLKTNHVQVAVNANRFGPTDYYLPAMTPMDVYGLAIDQGVTVSEADDPDNAATIIFDAVNHPSIAYSNWPPANLDGAFTAISGTYPILEGGRDIARSYRSGSDPIHGVNPRTLFGLSADRRYFYLMTIDGRQPGYSDGAYDYEAAEILLLLGAADAVNMDGGGSTTLVIEGSTGSPVRLNKSSAVANAGRERTVGSHLGVIAKPLPGFINDVTVLSSDTSATVAWTTTAPASSQIEFGSQASLGQSTAADLALVTEHSVQLTGLTPKTGYYYQIVSEANGTANRSPLFYFMTTNYVTTTAIFDLTHPWSFTAQDVSGTLWASLEYDESAWSGPGPGLLWVDVRPTGPNPDVTPKSTAMPPDPTTGYPFRTYYLRTHFPLVHPVPNSMLEITSYVDDGAIFYLNGVEVYRLRLPPGLIGNQTLASAYPCSGDATCPDEFSCTASALVDGDNVLAVEVHNYNAKSSDITFGASVSLVEPVARAITLNVSYTKNALTLDWQGSGLVLQSAPSLSGPWTDVSGATASPFVTTAVDASRYFRLRQ